MHTIYEIKDHLARGGKYRCRVLKGEDFCATNGRDTKDQFRDHIATCDREPSDPDFTVGE